MNLKVEIFEGLYWDEAIYRHVMTFSDDANSKLRCSAPLALQHPVHLVPPTEIRQSSVVEERSSRRIQQNFWKAMLLTSGNSITEGGANTEETTIRSIIPSYG